MRFRRQSSIGLALVVRRVPVPLVPILYSGDDAHIALLDVSGCIQSGHSGFAVAALHTEVRTSQVSLLHTVT